MTNKTTLHELAPGVFAHGSGALWIASTRTAIAADLHLGYAWAQRRRGGLGPLNGGGAPERILALAEELAPATLVLLGDIVHAPHPAPEERTLIENTLMALRARCKLVCVLGNHDRRFMRDFGEPGEHEWRCERLVAVHGNRLPLPIEDTLIVAGHFHPVIRWRDSAGASRATRVFVHGAGLCVLPAFSPFAAGCDVRYDMPPELQRWFGKRKFNLIAASGREVVPITSTRRLSMRRNAY